MYGNTWDCAVFVPRSWSVIITAGRWPVISNQFWNNQTNESADSWDRNPHPKNYCWPVIIVHSKERCKYETIIISFICIIKQRILLLMPCLLISSLKSLSKFLISVSGQSQYVVLISFPLILKYVYIYKHCTFKINKILCKNVKLQYVLCKFFTESSVAHWALCRSAPASAALTDSKCIPSPKQVGR